ncbi:TIGR04282 family arsenosugar biosynthesis glycosyltransferase [Thermosynechococcaceae cyanobacterium BACA0444]|uniref:TIGR04282 family arsenosugar biosynthesis glycosyltransferase n=1 Tax=Pseudocalidococcus azoricus BACA0444 TaxID=2918990 RepID=A0AAE4FV80_9CYAN|nr:TIGR04282 family arsenosugar biosynthesis glycosyltransferase [Pseudocalidococcus azoricus]MDS3861520.1 TIGR04282 family arsenosugar biosynthesis glycosyltransferase [Pseudocalidococcus azoricus BACA0444]
MTLGLLIFTRYPEPGRSKTRLIPALGATGAAQFHQKMAEHTLHQARTFAQAIKSRQITVWFTGGNVKLMQAWLGTGINYQIQPEGDLGARLLYALGHHFQTTDHPALVIGTDCPELTVPILTQAQEALTNHDLVIGPAQDGGYYLIGLKKVIPELFQTMAWGSDQVFRKSFAIAQDLGLSTALLPELTDIDRPDDLPQLDLAGFGHWLKESSP